MLCCRHAQTEITQAIRHEVTTMRPWRGLTLPLLLMVLAGFFEEARAEPVTLHGLTFSDELGGFTILNGWGSGSLADPITIVEEVTTTTGAVLVIRGLGPESGNPIPTAHPAGFVLRKIVINATNLSWNIYDVELQKVLVRAVLASRPPLSIRSVWTKRPAGRTFRQPEFLRRLGRSGPDRHHHLCRDGDRASA
jgi:hypothetical protein